jgi:hypothetical protein
MLAADLPGETERNRRLRQADWRFLMPGPPPATAVCFAQGRLAEAAALVAGRVLQPGEAAPGSCDLAVALNPDRATLRAAWSALAPGGTLYTEWHSLLAGGPPGVQRRLAAAGFTCAECYWPWPNPNRAAPLFWLPLAAPRALDFFLATRPRPSTPRRRASNGLLRAAWRLARRAQLLLPLCVTAGKPHAGKPGAHQEQPVLDRLHDYWSEWGLGPAPRRLAWLLLTGGSSSLNKAAGLVFADSNPRPQVIVKLPRRPESAVSLAREAAALRAVAAGRPGGLPGVPQVVFFQDQPEVTALGETVLTGQPIYLGLRRENYRELALRVTGWLAGLAGPAAPCPRAEWWPRLVEPALAEFEGSFGAALEPGELRQARARLATLGPLPLVPEQRDCSPWNVLLSPAGEVIVLDWESAEPRGLPALDLIYFLAFLAFFLEGAMETRRFGESIRAALDPASFTGRVQAECQARYSAALGLDPAALRPLRLLAWLIHSRSEYRQLRAETGGPPAPETLRGSLFVQLWQAELEHNA